MKKRIAILGSTGSIGTNALDVIRKHRDKFEVVALSAHSNIKLLSGQIREFNPGFVCVGSGSDGDELRKKFKLEVLSGDEGLCKIARLRDIDTILVAVVGSAALFPLMAAIKTGKRIALANKEALVIAGGLVMGLAKKYHAEIIPVDSEHSAIFQCLKNENRKSVSRLIITCSGGPFYRRRKPFDKITVAETLKHPRWLMGRKITVDSATLVNKGLEVIEAHHLFGIPFESISVLIHPQSIVHSMVEFRDNSVIAQLSSPDMRLAIQYAFTYPERLECNVKRLNPESLARLEFCLPDNGRFPCLELVIEAGKAGHTMPAVMNAANEVSVEAFLKNRIKFNSIPKIIENTMKKHRIVKNPSIEDIMEADSWSRKTAEQQIKKH